MRDAHVDIQQTYMCCKHYVLRIIDLNTCTPACHPAFHPGYLPTYLPNLPTLPTYLTYLRSFCHLSTMPLDKATASGHQGFVSGEAYKTKLIHSHLNVLSGLNVLSMISGRGPVVYVVKRGNTWFVSSCLSIFIEL